MHSLNSSFRCRYHAVIQYKAQETEDSIPCGFYLYDLGSSHGSIVNKKPVKAKHYVPLKVGHVIKLGCSTRLYILGVNIIISMLISEYNE